MNGITNIKINGVGYGLEHMYGNIYRLYRELINGGFEYIGVMNSYPVKVEV